MRIKFIIILFLASISINSYSQYKQPDLGKKVDRSTSNLILGIFNPKNFSMSHSFQVSMLSSSYGNISVTSYINTMQYKFNDKLNISADVALRYAPYVSSGFGNDYANRLKNDLNGLSLSRLTLDYKISEDSHLRLEYRNLDDMYYNYNDYYYRNRIFGY